jgi:hypothetical protein
MPQILIYLQFASAAAKAFENVKIKPASTTSGQHGVIAEDRRPRRAGAQEGAPSSRKSLFLFFTCIGDALFQKILILVY